MRQMKDRIAVSPLAADVIHRPDRGSSAWRKAIQCGVCEQHASPFASGCGVQLLHPPERHPSGFAALFELTDSQSRSALPDPKAEPAQLFTPVNAGTEQGAAS